jgi:hypothetical protein
VRRNMAAVAMLAVSVLGCSQVRAPSTPTMIPGHLDVGYAILSGTRFDSLVNSIVWVDGFTRSRCTTETCTDSVPVQIEANAASFTIDSLNPGPQGVLVARVRNKGSDTTYMYHFKPAPYRYFFLVKRSAGTTRWVLLEQTPGSPPDSVSTGPFTWCFDHPPATGAHADFRRCGPRIYPALGRSQMTGLTSTDRTIGSDKTAQYSEAGAWIGCAYGCCPMAY